MDRLRHPIIPVPPRAHSPASSRTYTPPSARTYVRATPNPVPLHINSTYTGFPNLPSRRNSTTSWVTQEKSIKYGKGKYSDVELVPQPSDDSEDPLNWQTWRKDLNLAALLIMVGLCNGMKTALLPTNAAITSHFKTSYTTVAFLTAAPLLLSVPSGLLSSILARLCGKRPLYLAGTMVALIGCIWNVTAFDDYASCLGARLFQGLGWSIFDTLVLSSIQDTYFEHQRDLRVIIYNVLSISTTWGTPLVSGALGASSFTAPFNVIAIFFLFAVPMIALAAPETAFDRASASEPPTPVSGFTLSRRWQPWRLKHRLTKDRLTDYFKSMKPCTFAGPITKSIVLQIPRAMCAPTSLLIVALTMIPVCALWGLGMSISLLLNAEPLSLGPEKVGTVFVGPWLLPMFVVATIGLYRGVHVKFNKATVILIIGCGSALALVGILAFGLGLFNFLSPTKSSGQQLFFTTTSGQVSVPLLSFQLAILATSIAVLDTATRPLLTRSASFTSSNMAIAVRSIGDMNTAVILWRNLFTAIFIVVIPYVINASPQTGIKGLTIGLTTVQAIIATLVVLSQLFFDSAIWRADGKIMGLVDLSSLKLSVSFFDTD
ncbi:hypothetical protein VHEMI07990 [[Torrubiella] hemipterigena]|uniref:Major facilitator superfamily (MFS) profile domain-containing protein n=1 Tax=[Torrubiella] hemipterigena TaxID=1531966 RepID=A0A0A1TMD7_9HYPO|nr:hypothetical protein VHEMI07990 [[Torrubiella] hemipterigena]